VILLLGEDLCDQVLANAVQVGRLACRLAHRHVLLHLPVDAFTVIDEPDRRLLEGLERAKCQSELIKRLLSLLKVVLRLMQQMLYL